MRNIQQKTNCLLKSKTEKFVDKKWQRKSARLELNKEFRHIVFKDLVQLYQGFRFEFSENSGELKLLSFTQILSMAVKRLDFCQLISEIYV